MIYICLNIKHDSRVPYFKRNTCVPKSCPTHLTVTWKLILSIIKFYPALHTLISSRRYSSCNKTAENETSSISMVQECCVCSPRQIVSCSCYGVFSHRRLSVSQSWRLSGNWWLCIRAWNLQSFVAYDLRIISFFAVAILGWPKSIVCWFLIVMSL